MENINHKKYSFIAQVLMLFAVDVLLLMLFAVIFGDGTEKISSVYQFGNKGLAVSTLLQFLLSSFLIVSFLHFFFSEKIFKSMMALWRTVLLFFCSLASVVILAIVFNWFPMNSMYAWTGFLICFGGGFILGTTFMIIKTRLENKKYNKLLNLYKDEHGGDNKNE